LIMTSLSGADLETAVPVNPVVNSPVAPTVLSIALRLNRPVLLFESIWTQLQSYTVKLYTLSALSQCENTVVCFDIRNTASKP
jgi:hypothetical protein